MYRDIFPVCLSNIIRSVSWQKDVDLRVRKEVTSYEAGKAVVLFQEEVRRQLDRIYPYLCVLPRRLGKQTLSIRSGNAVDVTTIFPDYRGKVDLLVTSPPYATALPYLDTDRLSLIVLRLLPRQEHGDVEALMVGTREVTERQRRDVWSLFLNRKRELPGSVTALIDEIAEHYHGPNVGFRRRNLPALLGKYFVDMLDAMRSSRAMMVKRGHAYYVVGNNSTVVNGEKRDIPTDKFLYEVGIAAGWQADEIIPLELLVSRDIFKENRGSAETILCFRA